MPLVRSILVVLALPVFDFAWGGQGHQVIAIIAEARLTDEARAQVRELLGDADMADAEVVNWADEIRRERKETALWHYVNIPHDAAGYNARHDSRPEGTIIGDAHPGQQTAAA